MNPVAPVTKYFTSLLPSDPKNYGDREAAAGRLSDRRPAQPFACTCERYGGAPFRAAFVQARHAKLKMTVSVLSDNAGRYAVEEVLIVDARASLRPAELVERKLVSARAQARCACARTRTASSRGGTGLSRYSSASPASP